MFFASKANSIFDHFLNFLCGGSTSHAVNITREPIDCFHTRLLGNNHRHPLNKTQGAGWCLEYLNNTGICK